MTVLISTYGINMAAMEMVIRRRRRVKMMKIVIIILIMMMMVTMTMTNILVIWETQGGHHTI